MKCYFFLFNNANGTCEATWATVTVHRVVVVGRRDTLTKRRRMGRGKEGNVLRGENELPSHWPANANRRGHSSVKKEKKEPTREVVESSFQSRGN